MMFVIRLLLLMLPVVFMSAYTTSPTLAQTVTEASAEDQAVQQRVRNLFREIGDFQNVFITVKGGVVTLKGRVLEIEQVTRAEELATKIDGVVAVNNLVEVESSVERRLTPAFERFKDRVNQFVAYLPIVAVGLIIFFIVATAGVLVTRMKYPWDAIAPNRFLSGLLRQVVRLAFVIIGIVLALDVMGATALLSTILGAAGILGLALGFAVRDTVENYIASVLLSIRQPFRPRDVVEIGGSEGYVIALTSRATILLTYDGNHVRIPNATVFKSVITNFSRNPERRFSFEIGVETTDLQRAVDLGIEELSKLSFVLQDPAPDGWINSIGDSTMNLWFGGWINQNESSLVKARAEAIRKITRTFEAEEILVPEPTYRLRFEGDQTPGPSATKAGRKTATGKAKTRAGQTQNDETESDVSPDRNLEKRVEEETAKAEEGGLLDDTASQEMVG